MRHPYAVTGLTADTMPRNVEVELEFASLMADSVGYLSAGSKGPGSVAR